MRKLIYFFAVLIFLTGCRTALQSKWKNFNAYYNTFYNAKQSYNTGLKKNLGQGREYNPLLPIRIHKVPVNAGAQDFDKAIEKGADVLRKYEDTKWIDDALLLIGKSYYFSREYFSADQKFQELFVTTQNSDLKQKAILWRGRVLLDMERYAEGVAYSNDQISEFEGEWNEDNLAEVKAILAQYHVALQNWELARTELEAALPHLPQKEYNERGYFLLGQIYERLDNPSDAFEAYKKVQNHYTEYRLQYLAKRKQAEVARALDRHEVASAIFNEMIRDDKNLEYKSELDFELARTEQRRGNYAQAEKIYKNLLRNQLYRPTTEIAARTYYGLAEIYRFEYNDFSMAAAYYDSAAKKNVPAERLPADFAAAELAESFGNYADLKSEIHLQDSLLWLGGLSPEKFDSVLAEIRIQKAAELERMREAQEKMQNTVVNVNQEEEEQDVTNLRNGFLNADNPVLQQNAKLQFLAVWGDRPLTDYWRVQSMIRTNLSNNSDTADGEIVDNINRRQIIKIDLSGIPFTKEAQDSVRNQISAHQYQLANLFFLSLDMPDSAVYYFKQAIENPSQDQVKIVSLYSLSELYSINENSEKARHYAEELIEKYPASEYASRLAEKFEMNLSQTNETEIDTMQVYQSILAEDSVTNAVKAENLKHFTENFPDYKLAATAQFKAIELYMMMAKNEADYEEKINKWVNFNEKWEQQQTAFQAQKDSIQTLMQDTTITEETRTQLSVWQDSVLTSPDFTSVFPYTGAFWDSARSAIDVYLNTFSKSKYQESVRRLQEELEIPIKEEITEVEERQEEQKKQPESDGNYLSCKDIRTELKVRGGKEQFLASIKLADTEMDKITYQFFVNQRGIIDDYSLITQNVPEELSAAFEAEIESSLSFEPILHEAQAVNVQCEVAFDLN